MANQRMAVRKAELAESLKTTIEETGKQIDGLEELINGQEKLGVPPEDVAEARALLATIRESRRVLMDGLK